jgi:hypothetical protein
MPDTSPPLPPEKKRLGETSDDSFSTGSLAAFTTTVMGFAFAFGVLVRLFQREAGDRAGKLLDGTAVAAATFLPLLMASQTDIIGLLQRAMFAVAYIWYGREAFSQLSGRAAAAKREPA